MTTEGMVLVVDDDEDTRAAYQDVLSEFGIPSHTAKDGNAALELMARNSYKLALLDFRMPDLSGVDVFSRMRKLRDGITGIMIAAFLSQEAENSAIAAGISQIFSKPVNFDVLLPLIQEILSKL